MMTAGLMNDHGQQARASENVAGPESLKNVLANLAWVFQNLQVQHNFHSP